jgi:hypothetical protein
MAAAIDTAGERLSIQCDLPWVAELVREGADGELRMEPDDEATAIIRIEADRRPFSQSGLEPLTRDVWGDDARVVVANVCTSGFDLHLEWRPPPPVFTFRWRPPPRDLAAAWLLRSRFHLLARAALFQYPAMWLAGIRGRAPLHASVCLADGVTPMLAGPGGVGKSTLLLREASSGGLATGDNLCVSDGTTAWGLVEPVRVEGAAGRVMPHGRREGRLPGRTRSLRPDRVVVLNRSEVPGVHRVRSCPSATGERSLVTGTYMAGELRRFWSYASTLATATGMGPAHAPVREVAEALASALPCIGITLGPGPFPRLAELVEEANACA